MTSQHFKELVETISMTCKLSKRKIAAKIGIPVTTFHWYQVYGLPVNRKDKIIFKLREIYLDKLHAE